VEKSVKNVENLKYFYIFFNFYLIFEGTCVSIIKVGKNIIKGRFAAER